MGRFWSILFLTVPVLGVATFVVAAMTADTWQHWLPLDVSADGHKIDHLFMFILWLTGIVFVATEVALFWYLWKYDGSRNTERARFIHGSHSLEVIWTIVPAATLLFIAIYQINPWAEVKMAARMPDVPVLAEVTGRQFEWRIRYPRTLDPDSSPDNPQYVFGDDDLFDVNTLHVPVDEEVLLIIKADDVLHSFFLPNFRVKQDVVPGMRQYVWFTPLRRGNYDLVCAELCGWGHYKMKGRLTVQSRGDFETYLENLRREQSATTEQPPGSDR